MIRARFFQVCLIQFSRRATIIISDVESIYSALFLFPLLLPHVYFWESASRRIIHTLDGVIVSKMRVQGRHPILIMYYLSAAKFFFYILFIYFCTFAVGLCCVCREEWIRFLIFFNPFFFFFISRFTKNTPTASFNAGFLFVVIYCALANNRKFIQLKRGGGRS